MGLEIPRAADPCWSRFVLPRTTGGQGTVGIELSRFQSGDQSKSRSPPLTHPSFLHWTLRKLPRMCSSGTVTLTNQHARRHETVHLLSGSMLPMERCDEPELAVGIPADRDRSELVRGQSDPGVP